MKHQHYKEFSDTGVVAIVIPVYNCEAHLIRCLKSIEALDFPEPQLAIVVVDDCSSDGTAQAVSEHFNRMTRDHYSFLKLAIQNIRKGAPAAFNQGIADVPDSVHWVWKLDADVELSPNALTALLQRANENGGENIGAVSSMLVTPAGEVETVASVFARRPQLWTKVLHYGAPGDLSRFLDRPIVGLSGASLLIRAALLKQLGGLDERFFHYFDDTDLCTRIVRAGYSLGIADRSIVVHYSSPKHDRSALPTFYYMVRNHILYARKHLSKIDFLMFCAVQVVLFPWRFGRLCTRLGIHHPRAVVKALNVWWGAWSDFLHSRFGPGALTI